jgi:hypothetical protein
VRDAVYHEAPFGSLRALKSAMSERKERKSNAVSRSVLFTSAILLSLNWALFAGSKSGFEGRWELDKHETLAAQAPGALRQVIKQRGSEFQVQSEFDEPQSGVAPLLYLGIMTSNLNLGQDGQQAVNTFGPFEQVCKTTVDGDKMVTEWVATMNGQQVQGHWTRTLTPDGKHMVLEIQESAQGGQPETATLHFVRK